MDPCLKANFISRIETRGGPLYRSLSPFSQTEMPEFVSSLYIVQLDDAKTSRKCRQTYERGDFILSARHPRSETFSSNLTKPPD